MCGAAGFHAERTRRQLYRPLGETGETELLEVDSAPLSIPGTHHNHFFCEIHTDSSNLVHEFPFSGSD
jgi:hypothetical protein